jgi:hypothetical protein
MVKKERKERFPRSFVLRLSKADAAWIAEEQGREAMVMIPT